MSHTNKYPKHVTCSYGYKLLCVDDKFSKSCKCYLGEDSVYKTVINRVIGESKYSTDIMKKSFNKELVMIKKKTMKILQTLLNLNFR